MRVTRGQMSGREILRRELGPIKSWLLRDIRSSLKDSSLLAGRIASWHVRAQKVISSLQDVEFRVSSQWGEDGIIEWLIERANIPPFARSFIEFGVEDYREANTRFLLQNRNWRGLIMDGGDAMVRTSREDYLARGYDLTVRPAFITRENINDLISESGFRGEIGLLSIDIDGNDYWVWEAIEVVRPIIVVCEYNAVFGDIEPISVPYDPQFNRSEKHPSFLYFGASIAALRLLGPRKGYRFVGTTLAANDAFFVREDYAKRFVDDSLQNIEALPSLVRQSLDERGELNYVGGLQRLKELAHLPVVDVRSGRQLVLADLPTIYSKQWLRIMTGVPEPE